jgi:hypothetical protein
VNRLSKAFAKCSLACAVASVTVLGAYASDPDPRQVGTNAADAGTNGDVIMTSPAPFTTTGVLLQAKPSWPSVAAQTGTADTTSGFAVFNSSNVELLRVRSDGNIGLKGTTPSVWNGILVPAIEATGSSLNFGNDISIILSSNAFYAAEGVWKYKKTNKAATYYMDDGRHHWRVAASGTAGSSMSWSWPMMIANDATVKIGSASSKSENGAQLEVVGTTLPLQIQSSNSGGFGVSFKDLMPTEGLNNGILMDMAGNSMIRVSNLEIGKATAPMISSVGAALTLNKDAAQDVVIGKSTSTNRLRVEGTGTSTFAGSVTVTGDMSVTGSITGVKVLGATYQDLAEWVPSESDLAPGTVVVLSRDRSNSVTTADVAYDTSVAGVISAQPGVLLGHGGAAKEMVATTGRVRVRVDASRNAIAIGDLLVTSGKPGMAMKSIPVDIAGIAMHRPGTIVGKALEPLAGGEGEILVLLSLQ